VFSFVGETYLDVLLPAFIVIFRSCTYMNLSFTGALTHVLKPVSLLCGALSLSLSARVRFGL